MAKCWMTWTHSAMRPLKWRWPSCWPNWGIWQTPSVPIRRCRSKWCRSTTGRRNPIAWIASTKSSMRHESTRRHCRNEEEKRRKGFCSGGDREGWECRAASSLRRWGGFWICLNRPVQHLPSTKEWIIDFSSSHSSFNYLRITILEKDVLPSRPKNNIFYLVLNNVYIL